ncbi:hypothetical protein QTN25_005333 [Entamoeba marina]
MNYVEVIINDGGFIIGDTIKGIVNLKVVKPIFVKDIVVYVIGQYRTKHFYHKKIRNRMNEHSYGHKYVTKDMTENILYEFYHSKEKDFLKKYMKIELSN